MASLKKKQEFCPASEGGLWVAEELFGTRDVTNFDPSLDVIFVSIDLEVARNERSKPGRPAVREFGTATIDTRHLRRLTPVFAATPFISTSQFSTTNASKDFHGCDCMEFRECVFAETFLVSQRDIPATISKLLRIQDMTKRVPDKTQIPLRSIAIVGHSIKCDIDLLKRLGVNVFEVAPVLAILDTHIIARTQLGAKSSTPMTSFTLSALLTELKCPFESSDLHNAGNDATYALHALLMLVIRSSEGSDLGCVQRNSLERLQALAQRELYEFPRWKPTRGSLGFHAQRKAR